jgi:hypothetical protein
MIQNIAANTKFIHKFISKPHIIKSTSDNDFYISNILAGIHTRILAGIVMLVIKGADVAKYKT